MHQSESIGALGAALSKAQAIMEGAKVDASNPFFKSKYADLSSVWRACQGPLTENGLSITQTMDYDGERIMLITTLIHSSGEWMKGKLPVMASKLDSQAVGSAITYARRYALAAMVGICPYDDDAESAMKESRKPSPKKESSQKAKYVQNKEEPTTNNLPSSKELVAALRQNIKLKDSGLLEEYFGYCEERVNKPMTAVVDIWLANPEPFKEHYAKWVMKKEVEENTSLAIKEA